MTAAKQEIVQATDNIPAAPVAHSESAAIFSLIERAARDPNVDIDKMERLMQMQERVMERQAKAAYSAALAEMQPELPTIDRNGRITITAKGDDTRVIQSTPYALFEDINEAIRPVLAKHGFSLTFRTGATPEGKITVTGILSHREGHREETTMVLMHDSTGSKNSVQAIGSSISYGKRYTAGLLLNITSRAKPEQDDDGAAAGSGDFLSEDQIVAVQHKIVEVAADLSRFLKHYKVASIAQIPAKKFDEIIASLNRKAAKEAASA